MINDYSDFIKPIVKETIRGIHDNNPDFLDFYYSAQFSMQDTYNLLVKKVYERVKKKAILIRLENCLDSGGPEQVTDLVLELTDSLISLEKNVYALAHCDEDDSAGGLQGEISDLYGGQMDLDSTQLFNTITDCIEEMKLFKGGTL